MVGDGKTIQLKCSNCNGMMEISADAREVTCPYCGAMEKILDSDAVAVERIKSDTYKELEYAKMANERELQSAQEKKAEQNAYRKSKFSKVTIVFAFICCLAMFTAFASGHILAGVIALIQVALFGTSWLMGMQIIKEKKKFVYVALAVLGFLLIVPFARSSSIEKLDKLDWPDSGLAANLPKPKAKYGSIVQNDDTAFRATVEKVKEKDYEKYIEACKEKGFTEESDHSMVRYTAFNTEGYKLSLSFLTDSMDITLEAPKKMAEFKWPDSALAKMLPKPESTFGKIEYEAEDSLTVYVGNTTQEDFAAYIGKVSEAGFTVDYQKGEDYYRGDHADGFYVDVTYEGNQTMRISIEKKAPEAPAGEPKQDDAGAASDTKAENAENTDTQDEAKPTDSGNLVDGMRPEFKEAMDSYEQFYDEYVEFLRKYSENSTDIELLAQYGEMTAKAVEMDQKFAAWEGDTLNEAELAYYAEVNTRIAEKILEIDNMGL